jgi:hypothetical protein
MSKCRCCVPSRFGQASREQSLISVITRILIGMIKRIEMYGRSSTGAVYERARRLQVVSGLRGLLILIYHIHLSILKVRWPSTEFDKNSPKNNGLPPHSLTSHSKAHGVECASLHMPDCISRMHFTAPLWTINQLKKTASYLSICTRS